MRSGEADDKPRWIYIIEIDSKWYPQLGRKIPDGATCLYVGQSQSRPRKRFKQHRRGHSPKKKGGLAAATPFRRIADARRELGLPATLVAGEDAWIRRDLMKHFPAARGEDAALAFELETAERLRAEGYYVVGPKKPKRSCGLVDRPTHPALDS